MSNVISKGDAMDFAENVRKLVNALTYEGFTEVEAIEIVKAILNK